MTKGNLERKPRQKYNLKITPEIELFIIFLKNIN